MSEFQINLDEQVFLRNEKTNKVYTLTMNRNDSPTSYDVTREWTVPNQTQLASKTDRFMLFKQAAEKFRELYEERVKNGYIEVMRKQGIKKQSSKTESHKARINDPIPTIGEVPPGRRIEDQMHSRLKTGILDRLPMFNRNVKNSSN